MYLATLAQKDEGLVRNGTVTATVLDLKNCCKVTIWFCVITVISVNAKNIKYANHIHAFKNTLLGIYLFEFK